MLLPSIVGVAVFHVIPMAEMFRRSFTDNTAKAFAGFQNYISVIGNPSFQLAVKNTILFLGTCIPVLLSFSLLTAYFVSRKKDDIRKTVLLIPMAIPVASIVLVWKLMFSRYGLLDKLTGGIAGGIDFLNSKWAFGVLVITYVWRNIGYDVILWVAAFNSVDRSIYEAADMDGANRFMQFRYITWPCILPYGSVIVILSLLNAFKAFREVYLIAGEYPDQSIYLIQHLLNHWLADLKLENLCAAAVLVMIVVSLAALFFKKALDKDVYS